MSGAAHPHADDWRKHPSFDTPRKGDRHMTLDEAIKHCEAHGKLGTACGKDHAQLAAWLTELRTLRAKKGVVVVLTLPQARALSESQVHPDAMKRIFDHNKTIDAACAAGKKLRQAIDEYERK